MIPMVDLKAQYYSIKEEIDLAIANVLETSQFILGSEVAAFETEFAAYCNCEYAVGLNSGTSALHLALLATGIGPGDEVITSPFTFVATVAAIGYTGATPVLVDIDPKTFAIDIDKIERALTARTKAIVPVHLFGHPVDMDPLVELAAVRKLTIIEDAAQAHGTEYKGKRAGSMGTAGCFSFYPGKNLGAFGEGGAVVTNHAELARTIRMLRDWGAETRYHHVLKGYNYRLEGLQGAILRVKLRHLEKWTEARRSRARQYSGLLHSSSFLTPSEQAYARHVFHVYAIRVRKNRDGLQRHLNGKGIQAAIHYPVPVHLMPAYSDMGYRLGDFPEAEKAAAEVLSLPLYPELTENFMREVVDACKAWLVSD